MMTQAYLSKGLRDWSFLIGVVPLLKSKSARQAASQELDGIVAEHIDRIWPVLVDGGGAKGRLVRVELKQIVGYQHKDGKEG